MKKDFNTLKTADSTNTWLTPKYILDLLGEFDVDPCASIIRPWDCAKINYTEIDNGLNQKWEGRVWLNPPYGKEIEPFMEKMSCYDGSGLALIFMRSDTRWFHRYILQKAKYIFLWKGRIKFCRTDGNNIGASNAPSCIVAWNENELDLLLDIEKQGFGKIVYL